jgi:hypothetical protein
MSTGSGVDAPRAGKVVLVKTLLYTGTRAAELITIRLVDVDLDACRIGITWQGRHGPHGRPPPFVAGDCVVLTSTPTLRDRNTLGGYNASVTALAGSGRPAGSGAVRSPAAMRRGVGTLPPSQRWPTAIPAGGGLSVGRTTSHPRPPRSIRVQQKLWPAQPSVAARPVAVVGLRRRSGGEQG